MLASLTSPPLPPPPLPHRYVSNARAHPAESKYRTIKASNKIFATKVMGCEGAMDYLRELGLGGLEHDRRLGESVLRVNKDLDLEAVVGRLERDARKS